MGLWKKGFILMLKHKIITPAFLLGLKAGGYWKQIIILILNHGIITPAFRLGLKVWGYRNS